MGLLIDVLASRLMFGANLADRCNSLLDEAWGGLADSAAEMVYLHDLAGKILAVNRAAELVTGYRREELCGQRLGDLLSPESSDLIRHMIARSLGSGSRTSYEVTLIRRDRTRVHLEVTSRLLFEKGRPAAVLSVAQQSLRQKLTDTDFRLLKSIVTSSNDAVLIAELKPDDPLGGKIIYVNEAFTRMTGYAPAEALGRTPRLLFGPRTDRSQLNNVRQALAAATAARVELVNYRKDGSAYWVDINFMPIVEENGRFAHWVAVQRETTSRRQAENLERDRNRILELLARNEPLKTILDHVAGMIEHQCPDLRCSILLVKENRLVPAGGAPAPADTLAKLQILENPPQGEPAPSYRELLPGPMSGSTWSVPILSGTGNVLGAFVFSCSVARKPSEAELEVIGKAGRLAAIAVEQRQLTEKLAHQAHHDALTGLPNRSLFEEKLNQALAEARSSGRKLAVMFIDLDRFKQINDTLGHQVGDSLLQQVARRLGSCLRRTDVLARMGGDEFTVLLTELEDYKYSLVVAQKLLDSLRAPMHVDDHELFVSASIGISGYPRDGRDAATLQRNADSAMYRAKNLGRNNYQTFSPEISAMALESLEIENALRHALEHKEFQLRYQPQKTIGGRLAGLEALLVWNHARLGLISPSQFIPVAEESGLIVPIGAWALEQACRQRALWQQLAPSRVKVSVNVSAVQFTRKGFVESVARALAESNLDAALLELELTESVIMRDVQKSAKQMERLRALGVSLAIDDFGTGYSSLSYLRMLPIDTLKIDRSFLCEVDTDPHTLPLLKAIVALAHSLKLTVVAEGVENQRQLDALRSVGCDQVQGFFISEPQNPDAVLKLLEEAKEEAAARGATCAAD